MKTVDRIELVLFPARCVRGWSFRKGVCAHDKDVNREFYPFGQYV